MKVQVDTPEGVVVELDLDEEEESGFFEMEEIVLDWMKEKKELCATSLSDLSGLDVVICEDRLRNLFENNFFSYENGTYYPAETEEQV